ncbi:uncharacterized protein F4817DRAFT_156855 [Daldinia loculata]|uniref:uncharacterized protein n=1 Tax=Daldinia loculata TaxID=103429 RepID=UPI0020C2F3AD|nr:uncharacterized protein F4817DRAFT_156855 [Daldinia loculata]KAI1646052.1 hypothetical protein F4817DRAFT_156855 [Daldinia loculata]
MRLIRIESTYMLLTCLLCSVSSNVCPPTLCISPSSYIPRPTSHAFKATYIPTPTYMIHTFTTSQRASSTKTLYPRFGSLANWFPFQPGRISSSHRTASRCRLKPHHT